MVALHHTKLSFWICRHIVKLIGFGFCDYVSILVAGALHVRVVKSMFINHFASQIKLYFLRSAEVQVEAGVVAGNRI